MKKHVAEIISAFLICLPVLAQADDMTLEIIELKHRMTVDVVDILRPMVVPGGTVTGMNNQLIIKTTPENLAEIKTILDSLDHSPRRLMISVKQDIGGQIQSRQQSVAGRYTTGDVTVGTGDTRLPRDGLVISGSDADGNVVRYRMQDSTVSTSDKNTHTVQATEGYPAYISTGQSVPVKNNTGYVTPDGSVVISDGVEYVNADSGFYVMPRLNGNQVTLLIAPQLTRVGPGKAPVFDVQNVETTATGQLGEWIELGGLNQQFNNSGYRGSSSSNTRGSELRSIFVKVVEIE